MTEDDARRRREEARRRSLDALARLAEEATPPPPRPTAPDPAPSPATSPAPGARAKAAGEPAPRAAAPLEGKAAEEAERKAWAARRARELAQAEAATERARAPPPASPRGGFLPQYRPRDEPPSTASPEPAPTPEDVERERRARFEARRMKQESAREFTEKRKMDLLRARDLETRGPHMRPWQDMPPGVTRRPGTAPPSLHDKIQGVLGDPAPSRQTRARERDRRKGR